MIRQALTLRWTSLLVALCAGACFLASAFVASPLSGARPTPRTPAGLGAQSSSEDQLQACAAAAGGLAMLAAVAALRRRTTPTAARALVQRAQATAVPNSAFTAPAFATASPLLSASASKRGCMTVMQSTSSAGTVMEAPVEVKYEVGEKLHGFTCKRVEYVKEFGCTGYLFEHDKSKAQLISMVQPADENKTFGVVFRTPPENSNGIAHVLEHSVLCGSRKYPVKEPFAELLKSSLQTFLNAFTMPDRTFYPVASCNLQDFYNLVDVYLDAVLHPRAVSDPNVLKQEGWHYELENKEDPLKYKGVVFNEMKGVYSDPDNAHSRLAMQAVFPDNPYGADYGGDPREIPDLDFDYLRNFHKKYYHPSNAKFWFYGDDPADKRLELLDSFLNEFDSIDVDSAVPPQPLFSEPKRVVGEFAVGEDEDISNKTIMSVNWVIDKGQTDLQTSWSLSFLNYLLMGTSAAPLYKALVDSGLGSRVIGGGLYEGLLQPIFSVGLKDIAHEDVEKVEEVISKTLKKLVEGGFPEDAVKAAINTIEFRSREMNTGRFPKGLALMMASVERWNYDNDPFEPLRFEAPLADLKDRLAKGEKIFETLIQEKLLDNPHKVVVESRPDKEHGQKIEAEEKGKLEEHKKLLDEAMLEDVLKESKLIKDLAEKVDSPEDLAIVPRLSLDDIAKEAPQVPSEERGSNPTVLVHPLPTSGVVYLDVAFDLSKVPERLLKLVPFFSTALRQLGTSKGDFVDLTQRIGRDTGGISASTTCMSQKDSDKALSYLMMRGKAMSDQVPQLVAIMQELSLMVDFDNKERVVQLLRQAQAGQRSQLLSSGHMVSALRLGSQASESGWINEQWRGLTQYKYLCGLLETIEAGNWETLAGELKDLQECIFTQSGCSVLNITCEEEHISGAQAALEAFSASLPKTTGSSGLVVPALKKASEAIVVPTQVNYVGKGGNLYDGGYKLHGSAFVVNKYLGMTYLWDRVRMSGGAYGARSQFDQYSGNFLYWSYRDPNLEKTLATFDEAPKFLKGLDVSDEELAASIIGCMGDVDAYLLPDAKGYEAMVRHLLGVDQEYRQKLRDEILSTTAKDFKSFGESLEAVTENGGICVVASKDAVEKAKEKYKFDVQNPLAAETP